MVSTFAVDSIMEFLSVFPLFIKEIITSSWVTSLKYKSATFDQTPLCTCFILTISAYPHFVLSPDDIPQPQVITPYILSPYLTLLPFHLKLPNFLISAWQYLRFLLHRQIYLCENSLQCLDAGGQDVKRLTWLSSFVISTAACPFCHHTRSIRHKRITYLLLPEKSAT